MARNLGESHQVTRRKHLEVVGGGGGRDSGSWNPRTLGTLRTGAEARPMRDILLSEESRGRGWQRTWRSSVQTQKQRAKCRERAGKINKTRWETELHCVERNADFIQRVKKIKIKE